MRKYFLTNDISTGPYQEISREEYFRRVRQIGIRDPNFDPDLLKAFYTTDQHRGVDGSIQHRDIWCVICQTNQEVEALLSGKFAKLPQK